MQILNRPTITVPRSEIHPCVDAGRILAQRPLHSTEPFKAFLPIDQSELAKAAKGIPDGYLILCLPIFLPFHEVVHGFLERAFQPALHRDQRRPFVVQKVEQLHGEVWTRIRLGFDQIHHHRKELVGTPLVGRNETVHPEICHLALAQLGQGAPGELPNTFYDRCTQHLRNSPEFTY